MWDHCCRPSLIFSLLFSACLKVSYHGRNTSTIRCAARRRAPSKAGCDNEGTAGRATSTYSSGFYSGSDLSSLIAVLKGMLRTVTVHGPKASAGGLPIWVIDNGLATTRTLFRFALIVRSRFVGVGVLALASGARLSIALAAQRLDQGVELVFNHTYSAGAYLHEAEPSGFYEIFVECGLADAEALQHLALSQDSLADHMGSLRSHGDVRDFSASYLRPGQCACKRLKNKAVALIAEITIALFAGTLVNASDALL